MVKYRRRFLATASGAMAAAAGAVGHTPNVIAQPKVQWRMSTAFTAVFDIHQGAAQRLAKVVEEMSGGRFRIEVFPGVTDYHAKNAIALEKLKTGYKGKVEVLQLPVPVLRDLKKLAAEVVREESEKTPMARKVHASLTKFQALVGPWDHVAEGAYHQLVAV